MPFFQEPPRLPDLWAADQCLREHLERVLPPDVLAEVDPLLRDVAGLAGGAWLALAEQAEAEPPRLIGYDPWGRRVDEIRVSPAWEALHEAQVRIGLSAVPYEGAYDEHARVVQHALVHLYAPSSATYSCPVAMTDAAARVLRDHADPALRDRVVPRLTSRDVARAWTSGQWMTEREGGSDVGRTDTRAQLGEDGRWRLFGTKWFTSATTADCALALARPEGAPSGSPGLGLFLVELVDPHTGERLVGRTILVNRLKDKLGTKSLPTAELTLDGAVASPVGGVEHGLRKISGMLNVTRAHNAMASAAGMRRGVLLAVAYARARSAFGERLVNLPLHRENLAEMSVEAEAAFALALRVQQVMGRVEAGTAAPDEPALLRGLTPVAKLLTAKDAVALASEALECFGGAGYIEDTGLPALLRNAQVLPIWEGTTNVLALDLLRAATTHDAVTVLLRDVGARLEGAEVPRLSDAVREVARSRDGLEAAAARWATEGPAGTADAAGAPGGAGTLDQHPAAGMRAFALRLGRTYAAALLCEHAAHRLAKHNDSRAAEVARRYAARWLADAYRPGPAGGATAVLGL